MPRALHEAPGVLASLRSAAVFGVDAYPVQIEVDVSFGLPHFTMVGLPDATVRESRDRVRSAIKNSGFEFPPHRITVNLAPADVRKAGSSFDLPIALGLLATSGLLTRRAIDDTVVLGELSLDGAINGIRGVLPIAVAARRLGLTRLLLPPQNAAEACVVDGLDVCTARSLPEAVDALNRPEDARRAPRRSVPPPAPAARCGRRSRGRPRTAPAAPRARGRGGRRTQPAADRTARRRQDDAGEEAGRDPAAADLRRGARVHGDPFRGRHASRRRRPAARARPFRAPHHTISNVALVGGGAIPRPGEISLAHNGVLFLDEMPEFDRRVLEVLRQPLEEGRVTIARAARTAVFPARFVLVAAMNPCPCGFLGDERRACRCTPTQIARYRGRLSGPLRDRIDLIVEVPAVPVHAITDAAPGESSAVVRERVLAARTAQQTRYGDGGPRTNADLRGRR